MLKILSIQAIPVPLWTRRVAVVVTMMVFLVGALVVGASTLQCRSGESEDRP